MEEARRGMIGGDTARRTDVDRVLAEAEGLEGLEVLDLQGRRFGRITRCFLGEETGEIAECEVRLDRGLANALGIPGDTWRVKRGALRDPEPAASSIRMSVPAESVVGEPTPPRDTHAEGAAGQPRDVR